MIINLGYMVIITTKMLRPILPKLAHVANCEWWIRNSTTHNLPCGQVVALVLVLALLFLPSNYSTIFFIRKFFSTLQQKLRHHPHTQITC